MQYGAAIGMVAGVIFWAQSEFASAGEVKRLADEQDFKREESFNENRLDRHRAQLEQLRSRQRATIYYPDDEDTKAYLLKEIDRALAYEQKLREQKANIQ